MTTNTLSKMHVERPINNSYSPYALTSDYLVLLPLMPNHMSQLYAEIFSQPDVMKYFRTGETFSIDNYSNMHLALANQCLQPSYDKHTGFVSRFNWAIITHDGLAGVLNIYPTEGRTELGFCLSQAQQGRALARRSSELVVAAAGEGASFIATANPKNKASAKSIEQIRYPEGKRVFFRDPQRQNVVIKYGAGQPRDYFISEKQNKFSFFSFTRGQVTVDLTQELQDSKKL